MSKPRSTQLVSTIQHAVIECRGQNVILDSDLAVVFGTETKKLNQAVKRNAERFGEKYAFQMSQEEFDALRSQAVTSNTGRGGRRYPPWVFTEHGVVMAATILDTEKAVEASKLVVDVFIEVKRRLRQPGALVPADAEASLGRLSGPWEGMGPRLQTALNLVLDSVIDHQRQSTVRQEAQTLISESIHHLKERLKKTGLENEEIAARATKLLAEAEREKSVAAKTRAETEAIEFETIVRKLRLLMEANRAMAENKTETFLQVLRELGGGK